MPRSVHDEYAARRQHYRDEAARLGRSDGRIALARGATFLALAALAIVWLATGRPSPLWLAIPVAAFAVSVAVHGPVLNRKQRAERGIAFYDHGIDRLAGRWTGHGSGGDRYVDATHPYSDDLDLFGAGSLFQLLWRGATRLGEDRLAAWLLTPADRDIVAARQEAVRELVPRFDLRETLGLTESAESDGNQNLLRAWAGVSARPIAGGIRLAAVALTVVFWSSLLLWTVDVVPVSVPVAAYAGCLMLTFAVRQRVADAIGRLERAKAGLTPLTAVLRLAEQESFTSNLLRSIPERLATEGIACSARIAELHRLTHGFEAALYNQFFAPLALTFGLPIHLAHAAELWRERYGAAVPAWLDAVSDFEALLSLAGYAVEHPGDTWPELVEGTPRFVAGWLGHPLLAEKECVRNDVSIGDPVRLLVVSGSNMAGKSTLMRAVGVNAVLAFTGAPVRAASLTLTPLQIGTVIRVSDSLQTGKSLFFAAIERLKRVTALAEGPRPLLFLLDELLAGTNSHDRRIGAEAVLQRLVAMGAIGIVTTHDLALTEIADDLGSAATNMHFRDRLVGDTMRFDYTLRPGVVDRGNALALMRLVGLMPEPEGAPALRHG
jgi:hypothetical protein